VIGRGRSISGDFELRGVDLAEDVRLGAYTFPRPFVALHPEFPIGNVGGIVLRAFVVTFDQRHGLLRLEAPERTLVLPRPRPGPRAGCRGRSARPLKRVRRRTRG